MKLPERIPDMGQYKKGFKEVRSDGTTDYWRVFFSQALPVLNHFANKRTKIILYILYNADQDNMVYFTYRDIIRSCCVHDKTMISGVVQELLKSEVLVRCSVSHYMINPAVMVNGSKQQDEDLTDFFNTKVQETKTNEYEGEHNGEYKHESV